ncbi:MAG: methyltransferase domain-containing protein, partial [Acidobacteriota bacterium]
IAVVIGGDPELAVTDDLQAANESADIYGGGRSTIPVVGPLIDLLRWLARPLIKVFLGRELGRQQQFNARAVRHLNELGNRLEQRVRNLEEALSEWSANPGGIDARVRKSLHDYDAALRQRHMTLFSALEEEVLMAHTAAERVQKLEERFVERAQAVDARFIEKDEVHNEAVTLSRRREGDLEEAVERLEGQIGEVMSMRSLLRRALDSAAPVAAPMPAPDAPLDVERATGAQPVEPSAWSELADWMGDQDYRSFQNRFRGDPEIIAERMREHVRRFADAQGKIADLGCGRGEFLDLLRDAGMRAVGVEINAADVEECRRRGHEAEVADLFEWLQRQDDGALGGIFMAQVIEHLPPTDWQRFIELAARKLAPGGHVVVETINPESLYALARAYVIDPTHIRPVHPELLAFLARRAGLHPVEIEYQSPVPDDERATGLAFFRSPPSGDLTADLSALREALVRLDRICCAPQEYTLQATRPTDEKPA